MNEKANQVILKDGELTEAEFKLNKPLSEKNIITKVIN